jgi:glycosyltransferase involved in cell wall biosynthesis
MSARHPVISAVLPAYNEQAGIEHAVRQVAGVLRNLVGDSFEVIVTNDGSRDRTGDVLARLQHTQPQLHLRTITHQRNRGYGAALASGFSAARADLIFFTDGDRQFDVRELEQFLHRMDERTDLVIGWRRNRADPLMRLLNARGWKLLVNALFGYTARDIDCAFKLFRREVWHSMRIESHGATFSAEFLIRARRHGFRIAELPVTHLPRTCGSPTGARLDVIARAIRELVHLRLTIGRVSNAHTLRESTGQPGTFGIVPPADRPAFAQL